MHLELISQHPQPPSESTQNWLLKNLELAIEPVLQTQPPRVGSLGELEEITLVILDDDEIARIHGEFLDDPTPTDVITFHHGEILASWDTAQSVGPDHQQRPEEELLRYFVHGLLHLNGYEDHEDKERVAMHQEQERILNLILAESPIPNDHD